MAGVIVVPDYQVGDKAAADLLTPIQLIVVDQDRTETLRHQEAQRVPAIYRHYTNAAAEAESKMLSAYGTVRSAFFQRIQQTYKRVTLDAETVDQPRFGELVRNVQRQHKAFPLTTNLAVAWALGEDDPALLDKMVVNLRDALKQHVRPDTTPNVARIGPQQVRLVPIDGPNTPLTLDVVAAQSTGFYKSNFVALSRARKDLQARFTEEEEWAGRFVSSFVKENCVCDQALTMQSRAARTDPLLLADTYQPGHVIAKAGDLIDVRTKLALDQLRVLLQAEADKARAEADKLQAEVVAMDLQRAALQARAETGRTERRYFALLISVIGAAGIGMCGLWIVARNRTRASLLPVLSGSQSSALSSAEMAVVRTRVLPELMLWLKQQFVQRLLRRGMHLAETQRLAALQVAELERRLEEVQGPLQDRLKVYEQRIIELERELEKRTVENRELLQATIKMARARLEARRGQDKLAWN